MRRYLFICVLFILLLTACGQAEPEEPEVPYPTEKMTLVKTVVQGIKTEPLEGGGCVAYVREFGDQFNLQGDWYCKPKRIASDSSDAEFCGGLSDYVAYSALVTRAMPDEECILEDVILRVDEIPTKPVSEYKPPKGY